MTCYISTCCDMKRYGVAHTYTYILSTHKAHAARYDVMLLLPIYTSCVYLVGFYVELLTAVYLSIMFYNQSAFHFDIIILSTICVQYYTNWPTNHRSSRAKAYRKLLFWMIIRLAWVYFLLCDAGAYNHKAKRLGLGIQRWKTTAPTAFKACEFGFLWCVCV